MIPDRLEFDRLKNNLDYFPVLLHSNSRHKKRKRIGRISF